MALDLTPRQVDVLAAIVATGSTSGAARALGISVHTVVNHLTVMHCRTNMTTIQLVYVLASRGRLDTGRFPL